MPDMNSVKSAVKDIGSMQLCTAMDVGMKLRRKDDPCHPLKSAELHACCKVGLLKLMLVLLISAAALGTAMTLGMRFGRCRSCDDD